MVAAPSGVVFILWSCALYISSRTLLIIYNFTLIATNSVRIFSYCMGVIHLVTKLTRLNVLSIFFSRKLKMNEDKNAINGQLDSINNNLTKLEKHSLRIRDNTGMIWLTLVLYIVYVEFFK